MTDSVPSPAPPAPPPSDIFMEDLLLEPSRGVQKDDLLLLHSMHETLGPDRKITIGNLQLVRDGQLIGTGTLAVNGHDSTIDADGVLVTRAEVDTLLKTHGIAPGASGGTAARMATDITALKNQLYALDGRISATNQHIANMATSLGHLEESEKARKVAERDLQARIDSINAKLTASSGVITPEIQKDLEELSAAVLDLEKHAGDMDTVILDAAKLAGQSIVEEHADVEDLRAKLAALSASLATVRTEESTTLATLRTLQASFNSMMGQGLKHLRFVPDPAGGAFDNAVMDSINLFITQEPDIYAANLKNYVKLDYLDGLHIMREVPITGEQYKTELQAGDLHLESPHAHTFLDQVAIGDWYPNAGSSLSSSGDVYLRFIHPSKTHADPSSAAATSEFSISASSIYDFMTAKPKLDRDEAVDAAGLDQTSPAGKMHQLTWSAPDGSVPERIVGFSGPGGTHMLMMDVYGDARTPNTAVYIQAHPFAGGSSRIRLDATIVHGTNDIHADHDLTAGRNVAATTDVTAGKNISLHGTLTGATNLYDKRTSDGRFAPKTHSHPYLTPAAAANLYYNKTESNGRYYTKTEGNARYAPKSHTHAYLSAADVASSYQRLNSIITTAHPITSGMRVQGAEVKATGTSSGLNVLATTALGAGNARIYAVTPKSSTSYIVNNAVKVGARSNILLLTAKGVFSGQLNGSVMVAITGGNATATSVRLFAKNTGGKLSLKSNTNLGYSMVIVIG